MTIEEIKTLIDDLRLSDLSYMHYLENNAFNIFTAINNSTDLSSNNRSTLQYSLRSKVDYLKLKALKYFMDDHTITSFNQSLPEIEGIPYKMVKGDFNAMFLALKNNVKDIRKLRSERKNFVLRTCIIEYYI